jgi:hypothetical protein
MLTEPNRVLLQARLNAYNTALGRETASYLHGWHGAPPIATTLGLIDELLAFWEEHHGTPEATP